MAQEKQSTSHRHTGIVLLIWDTTGRKNRYKGERAEFRYAGRKKGRYYSIPD